MLKHLLELIKELNLDEEKFKNYTLVATHFGKFDQSKKEFIRIEMPKNEKEFNACEKIDKPILEIALDKKDPELCFITEHPPENQESLPSSVTYNDFIEKLTNLSKKYSEYEVLSSAWKSIDDNHNGRVDIPIVAVLVDEENSQICLVESASN